MGFSFVKYIILLLISFSVIAQTHPCDSPPQRFKSKNLNDLDRLTRFQRLMVLYPWYVTQCNGVSCSMEEFERMCYYLRREIKAGKDPNLIFPKQDKSLYNKQYRERFEGTDT